MVGYPNSREKEKRGIGEEVREKIGGGVWGPARDKQDGEKLKKKNR